MKWFYNMKVSVRMMLSVIGVMLTFVAIGIFFVYSSSNVSKTYSDMVERKIEQMRIVDEVNNLVCEARLLLSEACFDIADEAAREKSKARLQEINVLTADLFAKYLIALEAENVSPNELSSARNMQASVQVFITECIKLEDTGAPTAEAFVAEVRSLNGRFSDTVSKQIAGLTNTVSRSLSKDAEQLKADSNNHILMSFIVMAVFYTFALSLFIALSRSIRIPLKRMLKALSAVADGNLEITSQSNYRDEIGCAENLIGRVTDILRNVLGDITELSEQQLAGEFDYKADESKFNGIYQDVTRAVNAFAEASNEQGMEMLTCIREYADGNFDKVLRPMPGKKIFANYIADSIKTNFIAINNEIAGFAAAVSRGELDYSINPESYSGDWKRLGHGLNGLMDSVCTPVKEISSVLADMARGELDVRMEGVYEGEFHRMQSAINSTIGTLKGYVGNIAQVLDMLAKDNYDVDVKMDYIGDFAPIKDALGMIIERVNYVMDDISSSAEQVASGARQISESAMSLSQGAAEQASAVEELNSTIEGISQQTETNAAVSKRATNYAEEARRSAETGNVDMQNMLSAMDAINKDSKDIAKIIKVIDDIAFQTNLLALNASVEAARAGQHGRGFTVVAEQVGELARRSKEAAQNTTGLIESSIRSVSDGMRIANKTAEALNHIVSSVSEISGLVNEIDTASAAQTRSIEEVNTGITQIALVTQSNTATSEEEAAFAEQLASQSETFRNMVARFRLKRTDGYRL